MDEEEMEVFPLESPQKSSAQKTLRDGTEELIEDKYSDEKSEQLQMLRQLLVENMPKNFFESYSRGDFVGLIEFLQREITGYLADKQNRAQVFNPLPEDDSWASPYTVVNVVCPDLPFVIDSLEENFSAEDLEIYYMFYSAFTYQSEESGSSGKLKSGTSDEGETLFLLHLQIERQGEDKLDKLEGLIRDVLDEISLATGDFQPMLDRAEKVTENIDDYRSLLPDKEDLLEEAESFLEFLRNENFVFLGSRKYELETTDDTRLLQTAPEGNLGIMKTDKFNDYPSQIPVEDLDFRLQERVTSRMILTVKKTDVKSLVYRREQLDHVAIKELDDQGKVEGEYQFVGLFTDRVLNEPAVNFPLLRKKFENLIEREGIKPHTHLYRDVYSLYNNMPKHVLFTSSIDELHEDIQTVVEGRGESDFKLRARPDAYRQGLTLLAVLPQDRYSEEVIDSINETLVEEFDPDGMDYRVTFGESDLAQLHYYLHTERRNPRTCSFEELENRLRNLTRSWGDRLNDLIEKKFDPQPALELVRTYENSFAEEYRAMLSPETALQDVENLEKLRAGKASTPHVDLTLMPEAASRSRLIIYTRERIKLNEIMPLLSNHGLEILEQSTFEVETGEQKYYLHLFLLAEPEDSAVKFESRRRQLVDSITGVYAGDYRDDMVNELVTTQGFSPRALNLFRLYKNYFHQIKPSIKLASINRALVNYPRISERLFRFFEIKFDPADQTEDRDAELAEFEKKLSRQLEQVTDRNDYQILDSIFNLMKSTLRTNYYQKNCTKPYISVKIESEQVEDMPQPRPLYEVYVYTTEMEAIHLRHNKIARGGIRWSDRRDDYRTEVLGLVKTQKVKNALIVPGGAKGGFVLKQEHMEDERPLRKQARDKYEIFMRGLLDLTDNRVADETVSPPDVICYDDPDPYMVVAADKGTAEFSDTANRIAREYDFWLDDAFASGGSTGYDHKVEGITARGGWECVKRHFRELGKDMESPFSVVGIGDMGGDVFGNGMLLSEDIRLVGAFNHKHIFIDPDPDPAESFKERKRLYEAEAGWDEYDRDKISEGGGIYSREARELDLSQTARKKLGINTEKPDPERVIRALLSLDVELLWNGGIGTYIKASFESDSEVGDPANDECRVDASQVKADVIGEGGNLGITQQGRIELDRREVRLNTDAIDNSGGVDMSDHEVNIKILLQEAIKREELEPGDRVEVLGGLTDTVAEEVVGNNYTQSGVISLEAHNSEVRLDDYRHLLNQLEEISGLNREVEDLPSESEMLERLKAGEGMTRPELAVILSYAKMALRKKFKKYDWNEKWLLEPFLNRYFPEPLVKNYPESLKNHPLKEDVALTELVNHLVDSLGLTFFFRLSEETGAQISDLSRWYLVVERLSGTPRLLELINSMENELTAEEYFSARWKINTRLALATGWLQNSVGGRYSPQDFEKEFGNQLEVHRDTILSDLEGNRVERIESKRQRWKELGAPEEFADRLVELYYLIPSLDVLLLSSKTESPVEKVSGLYFDLGSLLHVDWIMGKLIHQSSHDHWEEMAISSLARELNDIQHNLVETLLKEGTSLGEFKTGAAEQLDRLDSIQKELSKNREFNYSGYQFFVQRLRHLAEHH